MEAGTATAPLIVLGAAVLGFVVLAGLLLRPTRSSPPTGARYERDDLAAFRAHPPGSPGAPAPPRAGAPVLLAVPAATPATRRRTSERRGGSSAPARTLMGLAAVTLLVIAAAAGVALATRGDAGSATAPPPARIPALPAVPDSPRAGEGGAGELALTSLPLGAGDVAARLTFDGIVLERQAVGVTVSYPSVSLTTHGPLGLAHVRLPTFNCLTADVPADPIASGCVPSVTEYADLPTPALQVRHDRTRLTLAGRFPTYVRPNGSPPAYTGRVYDLAVTATAGRSLGNGRFAADGVLSLATQTTPSVGEPPLDVLQRGR